MKSCTTFPSLEIFQKDKSIDVELYNKCKNIFNSRMSLPDGDSNKWYSFADYLGHYNKSDVIPTSKAMLNQFKVFETCFGLNPLQRLGLPQFAKHAMYKLFDPDSPVIFTFDEKSSATNIFRDQTLGGLCTVFKRHVTLDVNEDTARAAKYNKNGSTSQ